MNNFRCTCLIVTHLIRLAVCTLNTVGIWLRKKQVGKWCCLQESAGGLLHVMDFGTISHHCISLGLAKVRS